MKHDSPVLVTGLGAVTPLGPDVGALWDGLLQGRSGARALPGSWAGDLPVRIAAPVSTDVAEQLRPQQARTLDRVQQLVLLAAREAWRDAGAPEVEPDRLAVVIGSGVGGLLTLVDQCDRLRERGPAAVSPLAVTMFMPNGAATTVGLELGARGGVRTPVSACASGAEAISLGLELVRSGRADVVVCGGSEAPIHRVSLAAFAAARALSRREDDPRSASRPFDKGRDGFVLGEGAGVLVLESAAHAAARGAGAHAELAGAGLTADAHHLVRPDPSGAGTARAMRAALADAGAGPGDVVHVNPHATSTVVGDVIEAAAIRAVLGPHADGVAVSATKAMTGHLMGAAGAVEAVATVLAVREGIAPAHPTLEHLDDGVPLDVVTHRPRRLGRGVALSNSLGFGGHNVSLAVRAA
ncbi:beta-ketoacyl-[acyl-carrier-protein] synthase family protein [Geodermatophilus sp. SYSU D00705]